MVIRRQELLAPGRPILSARSAHLGLKRKRPSLYPIFTGRWPDRRPETVRPPLLLPTCRRRQPPSWRGVSASMAVAARTIAGTPEHFCSWPPARPERKPHAWPARCTASSRRCRSWHRPETLGSSCRHSRGRCTRSTERVRREVAWSDRASSWSRGLRRGRRGRRTRG